MLPPRGVDVSEMPGHPSLLDLSIGPLLYSKSSPYLTYGVKRRPSTKFQFVKKTELDAVMCVTAPGYLRRLGN